jgi:hypothetical protein
MCYSFMKSGSDAGRVLFKSPFLSYLVPLAHIEQFYYSLFIARRDRTQKWPLALLSEEHSTCSAS